MRRNTKQPVLRNPILRLADRAMKAAARKVIEENIRFNEPLIVWQNGRIKKIPAAKLK